MESDATIGDAAEVTPPPALARLSGAAWLATGSTPFASRPQPEHAARNAAVVKRRVVPKDATVPSRLLLMRLSLPFLPPNGIGGRQTLRAVASQCPYALRPLRRMREAR